MEEEILQLSHVTRDMDPLYVFLWPNLFWHRRGVLSANESSWRTQQKQIMLCVYNQEVKMDRWEKAMENANNDTDLPDDMCRS
jgi:hypothetical protein